MEGRKTSSANAAIRSWKTNSFHDVDDLIDLIFMVTTNVEETITGFESILTKLSFVDEPDPELSKLSIVGGYLWLITYGMQYISISQQTDQNTIDDEFQFHPNPRINTRILETHKAYEEIGEAVQEWIPISIEFFRHIKELRQNAIQVVKLLQNRYKISKNSFKYRPELKPIETVPVGRNLRHIPDVDSLEVFGTTKGSETNERGLFSQSLKVQWSPIVVLVQAIPGGNWEVFSSLETTEIVELIAMFTQEAARLLTSCIKSYKRSTVNVDSVIQPESTRPSSLIELTSGMIQFTLSSKFRKLKPTSLTLTQLGKSIEKFWIVIDTLYDLTNQVSKLVTETRDIVRSCYIYSDNFYNWKLKSFDVNDPFVNQSPEQEEKLKKFFSTIVGGNEVVDVGKFYSIADFSTSQYQFAIQHHPVSSHGVALKLESWDEYNNEPWGLVDNWVDKRKVKGGIPRSKKSQRFTLSYQNSK